jgi:hypothetical protein
MDVFEDTGVRRIDDRTIIVLQDVIQAGNDIFFNQHEQNSSTGRTDTPDRHDTIKRFTPTNGAITAR